MLSEQRIDVLVDELAELVRLYQTQCQSIAAETDKKIDGSFQQMRHEFVRSVQNDLKYGLDESIGQYLNKIQEIRKETDQYVREANASLHTVSARSKKTARYAWLITMASVLVLACGSGFLFLHYKKIVEKSRIDAETANLIREADIVRRGDRLCVNVEKKKLNGYFVVKKR